MILLASVFIPITIALVLIAIGTKDKAYASWGGTAAALASFVLLLISSVSSGILSYGRRISLEEYGWWPLGRAGFVLDGLTLPFALTISLLSLAVSVYSLRYMEHRFEEMGVSSWGLYYGLLLFYYAGMLGAVLSTNIIEFYIFFEVMLVPSYLLIAEYGYGDRQRIALMYFIWTHVGALVMLAGLLYVALSSGSFHYSDLLSLAAGLSPTIQFFAALAITLGFLVKMAAFGLHIWLPYAHAEAPTPVSALLSPAMIGIGGFGIIRYVEELLPRGFTPIAFWLALWATITMIYAGIVALAQDDIKRLLAYSSISQMGYMMLGISSNTAVGIAGSVYLYISHGLSKAILFMIAGVLIMQFHGLRSISAFGGLAKKMPMTATLALLGFLGIMGVPPTVGFISEFLVFLGAYTSALSGGIAGGLLLAAAALIATLLTWAYALTTVKRLFFGRYKEVHGEARDPGAIVLLPMFALAFVSLLFGIYPFLIDRFLEWLGMGL